LAVGSFPGFGAVPLERLASDGGDALEVPVTVQQRQSLQLGRGGHHEIDGSGTAVPPTLSEDLPTLAHARDSAGLDRLPSKVRLREARHHADRVA
jgi:hypothetical protein